MEKNTLSIRETQSSKVRSKPFLYHEILCVYKIHQFPSSNHNLHLFIGLIQSSRVRYSQSSSAEKKNIVNDVVCTIQSKGGRFVRFKDGVWSVIPFQKCRLKIAHAIQYHIRTEYAHGTEDSSSTSDDINHSESGPDDHISDHERIVREIKEKVLKIRKQLPENVLTMSYHSTGQLDSYSLGTCQNEILHAKGSGALEDKIIPSRTNSPSSSTSPLEEPSCVGTLQGVLPAVGVNWTHTSFHNNVDLPQKISSFVRPDSQRNCVHHAHTGGDRAATMHCTVSLPIISDRIDDCSLSSKRAESEHRTRPLLDCSLQNNVDVSNQCGHDRGGIETMFHELAYYHRHTPTFDELSTDISVNHSSILPFDWSKNINDDFDDIAYSPTFSYTD